MKPPTSRAAAYRTESTNDRFEICRDR